MLILIMFPPQLLTTFTLQVLEKRGFMSTRDMKIDMRVRGLFVRNYIDLRKVRHTTVKGVVYISGKLIYLRDEAPVPSHEISRLEREIRRIGEVEDVVWNIHRGEA